MALWPDPFLLRSPTPEMALSFENALHAPAHMRDQKDSLAKPHGEQLTVETAVTAWLTRGITLSFVCPLLSGTHHPTELHVPGETSGTQGPPAGGQAPEGRSPGGSSPLLGQGAAGVQVDDPGQPIQILLQGGLRGFLPEEQGGCLCRRDVQKTSFVSNVKQCI